MPSEAETATPAAEAARAFPLFYHRPQVLRADMHAALRLSPKPDFRFAADTNAVPVMATEMVAAARFYPIVFSDNPLLPFAVLGLERKNLFVDDGGGWDGARAYVPAYVRRYPFTFISQPGQQVFTLGIDIACDRLVSGGKLYKNAQPLFADGKPTALTQDAMQFCGALYKDHQAARAFAAALAEQNLLVERRADAVSEGGRRFGLQGFQVVDAAAFQALPDTVLADWHRKGWLALVHAHLASQLCWKDLVARVSAREDFVEEAGA